MRNTIVLVLALAVAGCDDSEKKAAEAAAAAEAKAKEAAAAAAKAKAEMEKAAAEAKAKAMEEFNTARADLGKKVDEFVTTTDTRIEELQAKMKKAPKAVKAKAGPLMAAYEKSKETLTAAKAELDALVEPEKFAEVGPKVTQAIDDAGKALADLEKVFPTRTAKKR